MRCFMLQDEAYNVNIHLHVPKEVKIRSTGIYSIKQYSKGFKVTSNITIGAYTII